jgi:hypothetical protein
LVTCAVNVNCSFVLYFNLLFGINASIHNKQVETNMTVRVSSLLRTMDYRMKMCDRSVLCRFINSTSDQI